MKTIRILPILVIALLLSACGGAAATSGNSTDSRLSSSAPAAEAPAPPNGAAAGGAALEPVPASGNAQATGGDAAASQQDVSRLVIKTAQLSLEVESVRDAEAAIRAQVARLGGYVVKVTTSGTDTSMTSEISFRVPAARFDDALTGVQGLAKKVLGRTISGDDVTEEFVDLDSRLRNLEATRDRLLTFLDKATKVEDALNINTSLSEVQGQIEQTRGRMQYLKQSAALSTVTVDLTPVPVTPIVEEGSWQPLTVARGALRSLIELGQGLVNVAIVVLVWTPVWLPLLLIGLWARRRLLRRPGKTGGPTTTEAA